MNHLKKEKLSDADFRKMGIDSWGIWEKEVSEFDWAYTNEEHCYIIEGRAFVTAEEETLDIQQGDYVVFPAGLKCRWKVTKPLKKYYKFSFQRNDA